MLSFAHVLAWLLAVVILTVAVTFGLIVSIGIAVVLCNRLETIASARPPVPSNEKDTLRWDSSSKEFWTGAKIFAIVFTGLGYMALTLYFWYEHYIVTNAVLWSIITLAGIEIGVFISVAFILEVEKAMDRSGSRRAS